MEKETGLKSAEHQLLELILPEGILDYFEIKSVKNIQIGFEVYLEERPEIPEEYNGLAEIGTNGKRNAIYTGTFPIDPFVTPNIFRYFIQKKQLIAELLFCGTDGTRTRDLRRDRAAF